MFNQAIETILKHEGGFVDHPNDPGGRTNFGISQRAYPDIDIKNLTREQAKEIYKKDYWNPLKLYLLDNANICLDIFDVAVNSGRSRAVKMAQKLAGVEEDGGMGPDTAKAINNYKGDFVKDYKHARRIFYEHLVSKDPKYKAFIKGWLKRVDECYFLNI